MSVLVAIKDKDRVVVGVDTRMSGGNDSYIDSYNQRPKAFHVDKDRTVIVGGVGNIALVDLLGNVMEEHLPKIKEIDRKYIVRYIVPDLVVDLGNYSLKSYNSESPYFMDGTLFIGINNRGYAIHGNGTVDELVDYIAMGSGQDAASGSLYTTSSFVMSPEGRIDYAIKAAGNIVNTVSPTPICGDTKGKHFGLLENRKK